MIQPEIGPFRLEQAGELPELIDAGAAAAIGTVYRGRGAEIFHVLSAWSSRQEAGQVGEALAAAFSEGGELIDTVPRENADGERFGTAWIMRTSNGTPLILFTNGPGVFWIESGDAEALVEFAQNLPY